MHSKPGRLTKHGELRLRKRMSIPKKTAPKLARLALKHGKGQEEYKGDFKRYLDHTGMEYGHKPLVYMGTVYIFADNVLVTCWGVPNKYHRYMKEDTENA